MLGLSRKTRSELMRDEFGASWEHFLQGAAHATNGFGRSMGSRGRRMRGLASRGWESTATTLAPLAAAYREGAADAAAAVMKLNDKSGKGKKGTHMARKNGMVWVLLVGAAAGVVGAMMMRRRKQQRWSEYDPTEAYGSMSSGASGTSDLKSTATAKGGEAMEKMSQHASKAMEKTADKLQSAASSMRKNDFRSDTRAKADEAVGSASDTADNMAGKFNTRP